MTIGSVETFFPDLRAGMRQRLLTLAGLPAVAWEDVAYRPVKGTPYISEVVIPVSGQVRGTGRGGYLAHDVMVNLTLHYPSGVGTLAIEQMAGKIMNLFSPGMAISYSTASVIIDQVERGGIITEADWLGLLVSISIVGHTAN